MTSTTAALLLASAGVGLGHAILPDHWLPLAVLGRTRRYPAARVARLSGLAGVAHVLVSIVLGAVIVVIGLQFRSLVRGDEGLIVGVILLGTAVGFVIAELTGYGHHHDHTHDHDDDTHDHQHGHRHNARDYEDKHSRPPAGRFSGLAAVVVPFGAAASPDLTILPVFLAAAAVGPATAIASVVIFAAVTIAAIAGLTLLAYTGGLRVKGDWLERWGNLITAATLAVIGALVLTGVI